MRRLAPPSGAGKTADAERSWSPFLVIPPNTSPASGEEAWLWQTTRKYVQPGLRQGRAR
jgi:hypothetical protein